ncbi:type I secretion system permease/ATPase [Psychrobacter arenosus]|uniref:type I secretion system permease/ATPase n=1 Tax=Psychrobacter arenosus TaxID=256326 RepID=UPI001D1239B7|nr:type I secretion system permease/ATPase [Psychrobacter arenosus]
MSINTSKDPHIDRTANFEGGTDLDNALLDAVVEERALEQTLADAIRHLLSQQGYPIDNVRLQEIILRHIKKAAANKGPEVNTIGGVVSVLNGVGVEDLPEILEQPDAAFLPLLAFRTDIGWGVIDSQTPQGRWNFKQLDRQTHSRADELALILRVRLKDDHIKKRRSSFSALLNSDLKNYKGIVVEAVVASFLINFLALAVSLFSMQVYDRVIPTRSEYTLIILASGVGLIILFEAFMKFARSRIMDKVVVGLDQYLSREVFQRLLKVRIDQMPGSVGSMAAQLRGYEQVRSFFTASTLFGLVDLPMTLIFITLIAFIASPLVAAVPIIAASIAIVMGLTARKRIDQIAAEGASASYYKTGLLVEAVEGVETIKAGAGSWKFLSRWLDVMDITIKNDLDMKHANDNLSYFTQMLQQVSYVGIVIIGSFVVMKGDMTIGGLIASSILGGRVLAPVMSIPNLLVQYAHAKAAKKNIDSLFALEQDNHGVNYPLSPTRVEGLFECDEVTFNYQGNDRPAVVVPKLVIRPGERIAILGPIGSGKSTLLKMLSGLYAPTSGRILLDGLDIQQISRETLSERLGYLQQDHRLFQGTLRENLLIGMAAPNDDVMHEVLVKTGLINLVSSHSSGLDLPISEGGRGLSGGQKQLVAFTRLLLTKPNVFLLDEPTASMDNRQEQRCLQVLRHELQDGQTFIVSTHKTALLDLVDRLIIMDNQRIIMDGPKQAVLNELMNNEKTKKQLTAEQKAIEDKGPVATQNNEAVSPNPTAPVPKGQPNNPIKIQPVNSSQHPNQTSNGKAANQGKDSYLSGTTQTASNEVNIKVEKSSKPIKINPKGKVNAGSVAPANGSAHTNASGNTNINTNTPIDSKDGFAPNKIKIQPKSSNPAPTAADSEPTRQNTTNQDTVNQDTRALTSSSIDTGESVGELPSQTIKQIKIKPTVIRPPADDHNNQ